MEQFCAFLETLAPIIEIIETILGFFNIEIDILAELGCGEEA